MKFAVIVFPGSNCDVDMFHAIKDALGEEVDYVWHDQEDLDQYDAILLPGGFSYGDYLRSGAIAQFANAMKGLKKAAMLGKPILGICNGFQILVEAGLLPGALRRNEGLKFLCDDIAIQVVNNQTLFTTGYKENQEIIIPIAHGEGNYYCDEQTLHTLRENNQIVFEYKNNPNGSLENIAGIINEKGNVLGMMPHPERAVEVLLGSADGLTLFQSILHNWREAYVTTSRA